MNEISKIIDREVSEGSNLDYKHKKKAKSQLDSLVRNNIVGMANTEGGQVLIGVKEENDQIQDIQNLESKEISQFKQKLMGKLRSHVEPSFEVNIRSEKYKGENFPEFIGNQICVVEIPKKKDYPASYSEDQMPVFPYRHVDRTNYMNARDVKEFIAEGIRPGSRKKFEESPEEAGDQKTDEGTNKGLGRIKEEKTDYLESNKYFFSRNQHSDSYNWTFHSMFGRFNEPLILTSYKGTIRKPELENILVEARKCLEIDLKSSSFAISQRNCQWFGKGAKNFVEALSDQESRYNTGHEFDIDAHHSESAQFIANMNEGVFFIGAQPSVAPDSDNIVVDHFVISFAIEGYPIDNRKITEFLDAIDYSLMPGHRNEELNNEVAYLERGNIKVEPVRKLTKKSSRDDEPWVKAIVGKNPFYENKELFDEYFDDSDFETLTNVEKIYCELKDHHPLSEDREYSIEQIRLKKTGAVSGGFHSNNAWFQATWLGQ